MRKDEISKCPDCGGLIKPDITFYGENLPARWVQPEPTLSPSSHLGSGPSRSDNEDLPVRTNWRRFFQLSQVDFPKCDLLIVMGTSLVVYPFAGLVGELTAIRPSASLASHLL